MISIPHTTTNEAYYRSYDPQQQSSTRNNASSSDISSTGASSSVPRGWDLDLLQAQLADNNSSKLSLDYTPAESTMQSDAWAPGALAQFTPKMGGSNSHRREPSLSSIGSAGPASPYNQNTSNPQIAVTTDFGSDGLELQGTDTASATHHYQLTSLGKYPGYQTVDATMSEMAYPVTIPQPSNTSSHSKPDKLLLPTPDFSSHGARSQAASVASSVGGDSPATPTINDSELTEKRRKGKRPCDHPNVSFHRSQVTAASAYGTVPKLDRTMTDIFADELYNPNFAITSTSQNHMAVSPINDVFSQRLNAANNQHLSARQSPDLSNPSRTGSPFRSSSPLATASHDFAAAPRPAGSQAAHFSAGQQMREQGQVQHQAQLQQSIVTGQQPETPKTISPKDAMLEFAESEADRNLPLFPSTETSDFVDLQKAMLPQAMNNMTPSNANFNFTMPAHLTGTSLQVPQHYPFVGQPLNDTPPRLSSTGSSTGSGGSTPMLRGKPLGAAADSGTYTCTYHGCTLRFETPALLQKHKREGHRQAQGLGAPRPHDTGMTSSLIGSQAGPHRCNRINPSTGKPCNTVFSRPYDLTRHEDTIHNARKQKVNCDLCTEEKTFSRADALTRHYRVCHPEVEVPGKRRRG